MWRISLLAGVVAIPRCTSTENFIYIYIYIAKHVSQLNDVLVWLWILSRVVCNPLPSRALPQPHQLLLPIVRRTLGSLIHCMRTMYRHNIPMHMVLVFIFTPARVYIYIVITVLYDLYHPPHWYFQYISTYLCISDMYYIYIVLFAPQPPGKPRCFSGWLAWRDGSLSGAWITAFFERVGNLG